MTTITFTGLRERLLSLDRLEREQLPFAAALALTRTAQQVQQALRADMAISFDRPTRATLNSLFIEPATKDRMTARVWINDGGVSAHRQGVARASGGSMGGWGADRAAIRWLKPQLDGGGRKHKSFERMLQRRGMLGTDQYVVPGEGAPLDQHGNIRRGALNRILSGARLFTEEGYNANRTGSRKSEAKGTNRYFVIRKGRKAIGVAERMRRGKGSRNSIRMVLVFATRPSYIKRFDFYGVADKTASAALPAEFEKAMARAVATRRT